MLMWVFFCLFVLELKNGKFTCELRCDVCGVINEKCWSKGGKKSLVLWLSR